MVTGPVARGQFHTIGLWIPKNKGRDDAILEGVEPSNASSVRGLEMRYGAVQIPTRGCQIGSARGWPPLGCLGKIRRVQGFRVASGASARVLVGARSHQVGRWSIPAFRVRYRVGGRHFETTYLQGMGVRVVRELPWAESSASFSAFQTKARNIGCAYLSSTKLLHCGIRGGPCYEMKVAGPPQSCGGKAVFDRSARVVKARDSWLYRGFRCYVGRASVRCRNQVFEGFFLSKRKSRSTAAGAQSASS